ncbi:MAG: TonB-dependent receptor, partial [Flammeovirgaceae bacterium]|nr:TonB-dependent receptor [Flammeovirgaceae bacterium]
RYDRLILRDGTDLANAEWYYGPQRWLMQMLSVNYIEQSRFSDRIRFTAAYQDYDESRHNRSFGSTRKSHRFENVKAWSFNLDFDKQLNNSSEIFYGAEVVTNKVGSSAYREDISTIEISGLSTRYPDGSKWSSSAVYVSSKVKWHEYWILQTSLRYSYVTTSASFDTTFFKFPFSASTVKNGALNGSVGLIYNPTAWKFYTNLSSGFRAPNVDDMGKVFDSEPGNVVIPNTDLNPEKAFSLEIGSASDITDNLSFDAALYYSVLNDAIARGRSNFNGQDSIDYDGELSRVLSQQNISKVKVGGLQLGISWQVLENWQLTSHLNWQKGKESYPDSSKTYSPTHVAPLFGSTHMIYSKGSLKFDVYVQYNGEIRFENLALTERADKHLYAKDGNGNPYAPSWWTLNLKASFKASEVLTVDAGFENILDKRYRPYSSGITAPGRNAIIALRIKI